MAQNGGRSPGRLLDRSTARPRGSGRSGTVLKRFKNGPHKERRTAPPHPPNRRITPVRKAQPLRSGRNRSYSTEGDQDVSRHRVTSTKTPDGTLPSSGRNRQVAGTVARNASGAVAGGAPRTPARRRVTIRDVANLAQVSLGTVSNVLNNPSSVATTTRNRVLDAINTTGFVRSTAAHQLRVGKSGTIGVVLLDIANPFFAEMARGAEHVLRERDYVLMLCSSDESAEREQRYFRVLEEHRVDGLLISPVERDLEGTARARRARHPHGAPRPGRQQPWPVLRHGRRRPRRRAGRRPPLRARAPHGGVR